MHVSMFIHMVFICSVNALKLLIEKVDLKMSSEVSVRSVTPSSDQMIVYFRTPE